VTGVAGVAGYNAFHHFHRRFPGQVVGTRRADNWRLRGENIVGVDVDDHDGFARLFDRHQFAAVLNCEGTCALRACELDPPMAWRVNVLGVANLLEQLAGKGRLVHLSIDLVFSGVGQGGHVEADPTDPVTVYGKTMQQAEQLVLAGHPQACILRISLPMGPSFNGHAGAIDWIQSRFRQGKPATLYYDEVRTPSYCDCLNRLLEEVLASRLRGLYHAGGPRRLSLYQIAQVVNRVGGYDPRLLIGCPRRQAGPVPPRAGDVTLDSRRLSEALEADPLDPWPLDPRWLPTDHQWHTRRDQAGSPQLLAEQLYRNPAVRG
jgi:dTDP-4-dehydrorhamnose reductase